MRDAERTRETNLALDVGSTADFLDENQEEKSRISGAIGLQLPRSGYPLNKLLYFYFANLYSQC